MIKSRIPIFSTETAQSPRYFYTKSCSADSKYLYCISFTGGQPLENPENLPKNTDRFKYDKYNNQFNFDLIQPNGIIKTSYTTLEKTLEKRNIFLTDLQELF